MMYKEIKPEKLKELLSKFRENDETAFENEQKEKQYILYRIYLMEYLKLFGIKEYDDKIKNCELNFCKNKEENMCLNQLYLYEDITYFSVLNDFYIQNLEEEELLKIQERISNGNYSFDEDAKLLIEKTYKKVLRSSKYAELDDDIKTMNNYDDYLVEDGTLVLEIKFDKFSNEGLEGKEWLEDYKQKLIFLQNISKQMEEELQRKLLIPVKVLKD